MAVISVSMNDRIISELDRIQGELGFSGRSEVLRAGARMLIADSREKEKLSGEITSVLMLIHTKENEVVVSDIKHAFEDIMKTQVHSHLRENNCLDVFILEGDSSRIIEMVDLFRASGKMDYTKLLVA